MVTFRGKKGQPVAPDDLPKGRQGRLASAGQIVIPALFVFPSLMLFVYLIFETSKLSREKIRHQFAIDAAAFVEMTNYSDFLNRTAYVNGAFPWRIFDEGFRDYPARCDKKTDHCAPTTIGALMFANGDYPAQHSGATVAQAASANLDGLDTWPIEFDTVGTVGQGKNQDPPDVKEQIDILTWQNAHDFWINWDEANDFYKLYVQIYQLLGSVEDAQRSVLLRLTTGHNFLQKSYWLNTGDPVGDTQEGVQSFNLVSSGFKSEFYCHMHVNFYGNKPINDVYQGWQEQAPLSGPIPVPYLNCEHPGGQGLFQLATVKKSEIDKMKAGYSVRQHWRAPDNYFNVNFNQGFPELNGGRPVVQNRVTCGESSKAAVWPSPTPKFQVRLYP